MCTYICNIILSYYLHITTAIKSKSTVVVVVVVAVVDAISKCGNKTIVYMMQASSMVCNDGAGNNNNCGQSSVQHRETIEVIAGPEPANLCNTSSLLN